MRLMKDHHQDKVLPRTQSPKFAQPQLHSCENSVPCHYVLQLIPALPMLFPCCGSTEPMSDLSGRHDIQLRFRQGGGRGNEALHLLS